MVNASSGEISDDLHRVILLVHAGLDFPIRPGDSVRIAEGAGLSDLVGNRPGSRSAWVPVEFGPRPPNLQVDIVAPVRASFKNENLVPAGEPPIGILVRDPFNGDWLPVTGNVQPDTARLSGLWVQTNGPWTGRMIIYDHEGIFVADQDLSTIAEAYNSGDLEKAGRLDARGGVRFWLTWNGMSNDGKPVVSGIYPIRLILTRTDDSGPPIVFNKVFRVGWKRARPVLDPLGQ